MTVNLSQCFDDPGIYAMGVWLSQSTCFITALILEIARWISVMASVATSSIALIQQVLTSEPVNTLSKKCFHCFFLHRKELMKLSQIELMFYRKLYCIWVFKFKILRLGLSLPI